MKTRALATVAALFIVGSSAQAQTVWRCGADGRSYGDTPCPGGQAVVMADARQPSDVAAARAVAAHDRALAHEMVAERHEREREWRSVGNGMTGIKPIARLEVPQKPKQPASHKAKKQHPGDDGTYAAAVPRSR